MKSIRSLARSLASGAMDVTGLAFLHLGTQLCIRAHRLEPLEGAPFSLPAMIALQEASEKGLKTAIKEGP